MSLQNLSRYLMYGGLVVLALTLFFWHTVIRFAPSLDNKTVVGMGVAVLAGFIFYFDKKLEVLNVEKASLFHLNLSNAIKMAIETTKGHVRTLRISAITSEVILPIFRDSRVNVDACYLMLHRFDETGRIRNARSLNSLVADLRVKWKALEQGGKIRTVHIVLFDGVPTRYTMTFDEDVALFGGYAPDDDSPHGNDFREPYILIAKSVEQEKVIIKENDWFDAYFQYWESQEQVSGTI